MRDFKVILLLFFCINLSLAQNSTEDGDAVGLADEMYNFGDKKDALDVYLQATKINPNNVRANFMAGKCYLETLEKPKAVSYFLAAYSLNPKVSSDILYLIARSYHLGNKFDSATIFYNKYKDAVNTGKIKDSSHTKEQLNHKIEKRLKECEYSKTNIKKKTVFVTKGLGDHINSEYAEYSPFITSDESFIVFTSRRKGSTGNMKDVDNEFFEDIYYAKKTNGEWGTPVNFGPPINTNFHEGCVGLSLDGKELYIYEELNGGDIYVSHQNADGTWTAPKSFSHKVNSKYSEPSLCVNQHKNLTIFSSDKPGGKGGLDLYYCSKDKKGEWSDPINLGPEINTEYNEDGPYFDDHTNTLYFSSSGLDGFGGYDVYKSVYDSVKHTWAKPENMGSPINTTDDDLYFVVSEGGKKGYYSSVKNDGMGEKDLYVVEIFADSNLAAAATDSVSDSTKVKKEISPLLVGSNQDSLSGNSNSSSNNSDPNNPTKKNVVKEHVFLVKIFDHDSKKGLSNTDVEVADSKGNVVFRGKTDGNGQLKAVVPNNGDKFYEVSSVAPNFMYTSKKIEVSDEVVEYVADVDMHKLEIGYIEVLRHVYYDFNKSTLRPESYPELDKLLKVMTQNPYLKLKVNGHTDNVGGHDFNIQLSQRRAESVVDYLVSKGIPASRLVAKGFGETKPIASNDDEEEGRELNRRTEAEVIK